MEKNCQHCGKDFPVTGGWTNSGIEYQADCPHCGKQNTFFDPVPPKSSIFHGMALCPGVEFVSGGFKEKEEHVLQIYGEFSPALRDRLVKTGFKNLNSYRDTEHRQTMGANVDCYRNTCPSYQEGVRQASGVVLLMARERVGGEDCLTKEKAIQRVLGCLFAILEPVFQAADDVARGSISVAVEMMTALKVLVERPDSFFLHENTEALLQNMEQQVYDVMKGPEDDCPERKVQ